VESVRYPGLVNDPEYEKNLKYLQGKGGSVVVFEIKGGAAAGKDFIDSLKLLSHVANVGDVRSSCVDTLESRRCQVHATNMVALFLSHLARCILSFTHSLSLSNRPSR
jgi:O-acetylhomoserine (thiol)-lyase